MIVIADTSGLLASIDEDEPDHDACRTSIAQASQLVISPMVLADLDYLIAKHLGDRMAMAISAHIVEKAGAGLYEIAHTPSEVIAAAHAVRVKYRAMPIGLTDAINVVLAARYSTDALLTLDRKHFRTLAPLAGPSCFRLLPDDL
ncbi:PIN domain-containing protein [Streptosporangiaceae bacterium NEAU-GS5]|nr:PIN domain-containing protein [Streptosporangiaceae bacterium NEAU-GS5]